MYKKIIYQGFLLLIFSICSIKATGNSHISIIPEKHREYASLSGEWDVMPIKGLSFKYPPPSTGWQKEYVPNKNGKTRTILSGPYTSRAKKLLNTGKLNRQDKMASWFRREFILPAKLPQGKQIYLHYGGIAFRSETWLNGKKLGTSYQCAVPVEYNVTGIVKPGKNILVVGITGVEGVVDLKNKTLMTPAFGMLAGFRDDVSLRFLPDTFIDDVFVKTSVKHKKLAADINLINKSSKTVTITPELTVVDRDDIPQFKVTGSSVKLKPGQIKTVTIEKAWANPELWSVGNGIMYTAKVDLKQGAKTIDRLNQKFGFREFETRGRDFYLNGIKTTLLRNSLLTAIGVKPVDHPLMPDVRGNPNNPYNCYRLHLGQDNKYVMDAADKYGKLIQPESSWNQERCYPLAKKAIWLPNTLEYYHRWVKANRNRPSVIIWGLANETYWGKVPRNPAMKNIARQIVQTVRKTDPTRPLDGDAEVGWDGLLDVISIHYPGLPGKLSLKYPNSGYIVPNDLYWLKAKNNHSWRAEFDWNKPLSIGEFWNIAGSPDKWSSCGGEDIYNWVKYSSQDRKGRDNGKDCSFTEVLRKACDAYRIQGVACMNPWSGNPEKTMPRIAVRPLDFHPNYYGGKTTEKKVVIFYSDKFTLSYSQLQCTLKVKGKTVWQNSVRVYIKTGVPKIVELPITPPKVQHQEEAELIVRLIYHAAGAMHEKARYSEPIFIMPEISFKSLDSAKIAMMDPDRKAFNALRKKALAPTLINVLNQSSLKGKKLLIVAGDAELNANKEAILHFAKQGGSVIFLQRKNWAYISNGLPEQDKKHVTTRSWKRSYNHPAVVEFDNKQLSYWRPDNLVGKLNFLKPYGGNTKVILDAAGVRGLEWTPLCETPFGKGLLVFSQLSLVDRLGIEPVADKLTENLIKYALAYKPEVKTKLRLLSSQNDKLENILNTCRVEYAKGLAGNGPILLDASYSPTATELNKIKKYVKNGGKLWLHNFTPVTVGKVAQLFPFKPVLAPIAKKIKAAVRMADSPLMNNLSTQDFFWARVNVGVRGEYLKGATSTAKLGDSKLVLPNLNAGVKLLEPALLTEIPEGKGTILFDTLQWEKAFETEGDRVVRIISALATNLGCHISMVKDIQMDYFLVDIAKFANMGYVDEVAQDGKGGWLDMGKADLCFFLINHTGLGGGVGMPVAVPPFPEENRFCGVPFKLTAPKKNHGKGMISLRSTNRALKLPGKVIGIPVNQKADKLFFIHAANYVPRQKGVMLGKYVLHYSDGTSATLPIRSWLEIGDWCNPKKVSNARICWIGRNRVLPMVGLYLATYDNPHPAKLIKTIDFIGSLTKAQIGLIGISGARFAGNDASKTVASWNFGLFKHGIVADSKGNCALYLHSRSKNSPPPKLTKLNGKTALSFNGSQSFNGNLNKIAEFDPKKPFSVEATFSMTELPKAYNKLFGIYQAMIYMKSGFRLTISTDGRVMITIFTGSKKVKYFKGKTQMSVNRPYTVKVDFEENNVKLFLNGKLDTIGKCPLPAPFKGNIIIGYASGMGLLKGAVRQVKLLQE